MHRMQTQSAISATAELFVACEMLIESYREMFWTY